MFVLSQAWLAIVAAAAALHWTLPARMRGVFLISAGAAFLCWRSPLSLALLALFTGTVYALAGRREAISGKRLLLAVASAAAMLAFFKARAALHGGIPDEAEPGDAFLVPLGLSYYALRGIHYAIERYKGAIPPGNFSAFAQYMFFLPALIAGPIHRFPAFAADIERRRPDLYQFGEGLQRILYGYVKISFIANFLVAFQLESLVMTLEIPHPSAAAYLSMVRMGLDLYFRFAGYSDIAVGFALLLGFRVMENFNFPFLATNISDFWSRWHISLTSWCRDYIYMGVVAVTRSPAAAVMAAMLTLGLWHEFSLRYVLWGLYNGAGIAAWHRLSALGLPRLPAAAGRFLTLHYFMAGVVLVRHDSLGGALEQWRQVFLFWL